MVVSEHKIAAAYSRVPVDMLHQILHSLLLLPAQVQQKNFKTESQHFYWVEPTIKAVQRFQCSRCSRQCTEVFMDVTSGINPICGNCLAHLELNKDLNMGTSENSLVLFRVSSGVNLLRLLTRYQEALKRHMGAVVEEIKETGESGVLLF